MRRNGHSGSTTALLPGKAPHIRSDSPGGKGWDRLTFWPHTEEAQMFDLRLRYSDVGFRQVVRQLAGLSPLVVLIG